MDFNPDYSFYDTVGARFYQGFMLGLCVTLGGHYITSNKESGEGRYDIQLMPKDHRLPGILLELKMGKNSSPDELKTLAETALQQILDRSYDTEMKERGISCIYRYGVAFSGKKVEVIVNEN